LIIPENEGVNWLPLTLEKIATVMADDYYNRIFKRFVDTRSAGQLLPGAEKPLRFLPCRRSQATSLHRSLSPKRPHKIGRFVREVSEGFYDLDVEDGPYEGKMGLSGTEINTTSTQLLNNDIQIAMAKGDGRMET
jgi:hypothetical protein